MLVLCGQLDPLPRVTPSLLRELWPMLSMRFIAQLGKTVCLQHVHAAFYQIARGLLLPSTLLLSICLLPEQRFSVFSIAAACVTTAGFMLGVGNEAVSQTSPLGIFLGIVSSLLTAFETIVIKRTTSKSGHSLVQLVRVTAIAALPVLLVLLLFNKEIYVMKQLEHRAAMRLACLILLGSTASCVLSLATLLQIKVTSPTTHMISSSARGVLQSALAVLLLKQERMSPSRVASLAVILLGSVGYTLAREMEQRREVAAAAMTDGSTGMTDAAMTGSIGMTDGSGGCAAALSA
ncbi:hypothetical protein BCR37DRAFT_394473 [Protomyces lactucae-debilis]|uniref:GDP-mannose transporter n=1 Tax=Protomyces lactucae-debilis TaxID=2754530 RepID=A0A1Y2F3T0_PROLT|nr:uncharacterized protein BCR37DRAFT_394473 [Protomyces lactucae-debilis]ORY78522.1 hypothetical protein BCR37DRAFT_394473 [Protomyces lactucae-debilis]